MEVYEKINHILSLRNISKRDFARTLRAIEPKLKSTGEVPTEKAIYGYLNGTSNLKIELIPYIAEALNIKEQALFDPIETIKTLKEPSIKYSSSASREEAIEQLIALLPYASTPLILTMKEKLTQIKQLSKEI